MLDSLFKTPADKFEELLNSPALRLEDLLDNESELLSEAKRENPKLLEFLDTEILKQVISYMKGKEDNSKYAYVSSELLSVEVKSIPAKLISDSSLVSSLFDFLEELDPTVTAYCCKAIDNLLHFHASELFAYLQKQKLFKQLVKNLQSSSVCTLLTDVLCSEELVDFEYSSQLMKILKKILFTIQDIHDQKRVQNACNIIVSLTVKNNEVPFWDYFHSILYNEGLEYLEKGMFCTDKVVREAVMAAIISMLAQDRDDDNEVDGDEESSIIDLLETKLPSINEVFLEPCRTVFTSFGETLAVESHKVQLTLLITESIKKERPLYHIKLAKSGIVMRITELFLKAYWNSAFHHVFYQLVHTILNSHSLALKTHLIQEIQLPKLLVQLCSETVCDRKGYKIKIGSTAYAIMIANLLIHHSFEPTVSGYLNSLTEWKSFLTDYLNPHNELVSRNLGERNVYLSNIFWKIPVKTEELEELI